MRRLIRFALRPIMHKPSFHFWLYKSRVQISDEKIIPSYIYRINVAIMPEPCNQYNPKIISQNAAFIYVLHCLYDEKRALLKCK